MYLIKKNIELSNPSNAIELKSKKVDLRNFISKNDALKVIVIETLNTHAIWRNSHSRLFAH
jgi:hypothetical protein